MKGHFLEARKRSSIAIVLLCASCFGGQGTPFGSSGGAAGSGSAPPPDLHAPHTIEPTQPGYLAAGPAVLTLQPGATASLWVKLYASDGTERPQPEVTWTSTAPEVAGVDAGGVVYAQAPGVASVSVTDGVHGSRAIHVEVGSDVQQAGPAAVEFIPPVVRVPVGAGVEVQLVVTAAAGQAIPQPPGLSFQAEGSANVTLDPVQGVVASSAGTARITPWFDGQRLAGELVVAAVEGAAGVDANPGAAGACETFSSDVTCTWANPPGLFTKPGLVSNPAVVDVFEVETCTNGAIRYQSYQRSPNAIDIDASGVVTINPDGLLTSVAPGEVRIRAVVDGVVCSPGCSVVDVLADLAGTWQVSCPDGSTGTTSVSGWPGAVYPQGRQPTNSWQGGTSALMGSDGMCCDGPSGANWPGGLDRVGPDCAGPPSPWPGEPGYDGSRAGSVSGPCSATSPCTGSTPTHCMPEGTTQGQGTSVVSASVLGPDTLRTAAGCELSRGGRGVPMTCEAPVMPGACARACERLAAAACTTLPECLTICDTTPCPADVELWAACFEQLFDGQCTGAGAATCGSLRGAAGNCAAAP